MQFKTTIKVFQQVVDSAYRALSNRPTHAILSNLLIEVDSNGELKVTGDSLTICITAYGVVNVQEPGAVLVSGKLLRDMLAKINESDSLLTVCFDESNNSVTFTSDTNFKFNLRVCKEPPSEYPNRSLGMTHYTSPEGTLFLPYAVFAAGVDLTMQSAASDEMKQILTCVRIATKKQPDTEKPTLSFRATNGHHLALVDLILDHGSEFAEFEAIAIPAIQLKTVLSIFGTQQNHENAMLRMVMTENDICLGYQNVVVILRRMLGVFPDVEALIKGYKPIKEYIVKIDALKCALDRCSLYQHITKISFDSRPDEDSALITIRAENSDIGAYTSVTKAELVTDDGDLNPDSQANANVIALDIQLLLKCLRQMEKVSDKCLLRLTGSNQPVIFTSVDKDSKLKPLCDFDGLYLIMPIQIASK